MKSSRHTVQTGCGASTWRGNISKQHAGNRQLRRSAPVRAHTACRGSPTEVWAFHTPMMRPRLPLPNQLAITLTTLGQPVACSRPASRVGGGCAGQKQAPGAASLCGCITSASHTQAVVQCRGRVSRALCPYLLQPCAQRPLTSHHLHSDEVGHGVDLPKVGGSKQCHAGAAAQHAACAPAATRAYAFQESKARQP